MTYRKFYAVFENAEKLRLTLYFFNENWNGSNEAAYAALADASEHSCYGPWVVTRIDVAA